MGGLEESGTKPSCLGLSPPAATKRNTYFLLGCGPQRQCFAIAGLFCAYGNMGREKRWTDNCILLKLKKHISYRMQQTELISSLGWVTIYVLD